VQILLALLILGAVFLGVMVLSVAIAMRGLSAAADTADQAPGRDGLFARVAFVALFLLLGGVSLGLIGAG
jgi:hypothetical protein